MTQDLQKRTLFAGIALAIFLPILMIGGLLLQIAIGIIAMLAMHELLKMRGLETMTMEGLNPLCNLCFDHSLGELSDFFTS